MHPKLQPIDKALKTMGYKTQIQPLSHFHDDYGFEAVDGEDDDVDDSDESEGSEEGSSDEDDESGSEA